MSGGPHKFSHVYEHVSDNESLHLVTCNAIILLRMTMLCAFDAVVPDPLSVSLRLSELPWRVRCHELEREPTDRCSNEAHRSSSSRARALRRLQGNGRCHARLCTVRFECDENGHKAVTRLGSYFDSMSYGGPSSRSWSCFFVVR